MKTLRDRVVAEDAGKEITKALTPNISPEALFKIASDEIIGKAYVEGRVKSKKP